MLFYSPIPCIISTNKRAGDAYTFAELKEMFENAGFSSSKHIPLTPLPQHLIVLTK